MINALRFHIPGEPVAKERSRSTRSGHHYTPAKTQAFETAVAWHARAAMGSSQPISGPVSVFLDITCAIPASWAKKRQKAAMGAPKVSRPDADNYAKSVLDGCNGVLWTDDAQVWDLRARKRYGAQAGVLVEVTA
jgi:Holliday junction resolvase RusA-like endonuclease